MQVPIRLRGPGLFYKILSQDTTALQVSISCPGMEKGHGGLEQFRPRPPSWYKCNAVPVCVDRGCCGSTQDMFRTLQNVARLPLQHDVASWTCKKQAEKE